MIFKNTFLTSQEKHCFLIKMNWLRQFGKIICVYSNNDMKYINMLVGKTAGVSFALKHVVRIVTALEG
jgi:hypothetical protein